MRVLLIFEAGGQDCTPRFRYDCRQIIRAGHFQDTRGVQRAERELTRNPSSLSLLERLGPVTDRCLQHHYAKGSAQRDGLSSAVQALKRKGTVEVPIVVGGKQVRRKVA